MEEKSPDNVTTEDEFLKMLILARNNDSEAIMRLLQFFEQDMIKLSTYIKMPKEDALQSMKLELIEMFKNH